MVDVSHTINIKHERAVICKLGVKERKEWKRDVIIQCGIYEEVVDKPYLHAYCLMSEYSG